MRCSNCNNKHEEKDIHESHDVPCYLFWKYGNRTAQKQQADKYTRRWLCKKCHDEYEDWLINRLINLASVLSKEYWNEM